MKLALVLAAGAAAALAACAPNAFAPRPPPPGTMVPPAPPPGASLASADCFRTSDILNHTIADARTLLVDVRGRGVYRIGMSGSCLSAATSSDPLIMRQPPGSPIACRPIDLDIGIGRNGFESRCIVESVVRLTPAEAAALPPRLRP